MNEREACLRLGRREVLGAASFAIFAAVPPALAQQENAARDPRKTEAAAAHERQLREDFPWLARYAEENARLKASGVRPDIVFMGDSITEHWKRFRPAFFPERRICRGIGGQTTPQMVLRMMQDVVALHPRAVHIMGGTNDIAGNTGPMTLGQSRDNVEMMLEIAKANGVAPLLGAVLPAAAFRWSPGKTPAGAIRELNAMLLDLAHRYDADWIDYHAALTDAEGGMREGMSSDGVHPVDGGYAVMERLAAPRLARFEGARR